MERNDCFLIRSNGKYFLVNVSFAVVIFLSRSFSAFDLYLSPRLFWDRWLRLIVEHHLMSVRLYVVELAPSMGIFQIAHDAYQLILHLHAMYKQQWLLMVQPSLSSAVASSTMSSTSMVVSAHVPITPHRMECTDFKITNGQKSPLPILRSYPIIDVW